VIDVPARCYNKLFSGVLTKCTERGYKLKRLAISRLDPSTDLTQIQLQSQFSNLISKCSGLTRLDISRSRVPGLLANALGSTTLPLEFINLSHVCLDKDDLKAVFDSECMSNLRDLNISFVYSSSCFSCCKANQNTSGDDNNNSQSLKTLTDVESDVTQYNQISVPHSKDIELLQVALQHLHKLQRLKIFDMTSDRFGTHRIDVASLDIILCAIRTLSLCKLNVQHIPLWDDDIMHVVIP
jgi:hypothetical protein